MIIRILGLALVDGGVRGRACCYTVSTPAAQHSDQAVAGHRRTTRRRSRRHARSPAPAGLCLCRVPCDSRTRLCTAVRMHRQVRHRATDGCCRGLASGAGTCRRRCQSTVVTTGVRCGACVRACGACVPHLARFVVVSARRRGDGHVAGHEHGSAEPTISVAGSRGAGSLRSSRWRGGRGEARAGCVSPCATACAR